MQQSTTVSRELHSPRLSLRPWQASDAAELFPILEANTSHLGPWIPARVATPVPLDQLENRLAGFANDFETNREWRYAMLSAATGDEASRIVGEVGIYPRTADARVPYDACDRVEIGYWLRSDATGQGYATEASRMVIEEALRLDRVQCVEIRCDARNAASAAVPERLGFTLDRTFEGSSVCAGEPPVVMRVFSRQGSLR